MTFSNKDMKRHIEGFVKTGNINTETQKNLKFHINRFIDYVSQIDLEIGKIEKEDIIGERFEILDL